MRRSLLLATLLAGCVHGATGPRSSADLEARVVKLEATNAKYAAALAFLQTVFDQQNKQAAAQAEREPAADAIFAVEVAGSPSEGAADAYVTIVEAFDFACPYCAKASPVMEALVKESGGKVRVVFKNLIVHPVARPAHLASCAAHKQGKYVEFKRAFWDQGFAPYAETRDPAKLGEATLHAIATDLHLDLARFDADFRSPACQAWVDADAHALDAFEVHATPTFFINGAMVEGALPKEEFQQLIDAKLKVAQASGVPAKDYYQREILTKGEKKFRAAKDPKPTK
jgi:protein-disulfide isomerase